MSGPQLNYENNGVGLLYTRYPCDKGLALVRIP